MTVCLINCRVLNTKALAYLRVTPWVTSMGGFVSDHSKPTAYPPEPLILSSTGLCVCMCVCVCVCVCVFVCVCVALYMGPIYEASFISCDTCRSTQ